MNIVNPNKEYHSDNDFMFSCQYHVIFCPKYRRSVLQNNIAERFKQLVTEKQTEYGYTLIEQEVMPEHVHLLLDINPKIGVYTIISKIKGYTSHQLREEFPELKTKLPTLWTNSRFISTVGSVSLEVVKKYIEDQKGK
jgi:putative transposase